MASVLPRSVQGSDYMASVKWRNILSLPKERTLEQWNI